MGKILTKFLQSAVVLVGVASFVLLLLEPQVEGVNAHATNFEIYFKDPFLALVYVGSIPFFIVLYQAFKVLGYLGQNKFLSVDSIKALQNIKYCALAVIGFVAIEEILILLSHSSDDRAGGVFMGILITSVFVVIAATAARFQRILQNSLKTKPKKDL